MSKQFEVRAKTYTASFDGDITIRVGGLEAMTITSDTPDTGAQLDRRNDLRSEIKAALRAQGADLGLIDWTLQ